MLIENHLVLFLLSHLTKVFIYIVTAQLLVIIFYACTTTCTMFDDIYPVGDGRYLVPYQVGYILHDNKMATEDIILPSLLPPHSQYIPSISIYNNLQTLSCTDESIKPINTGSAIIVMRPKR